jgi:hypothetical protein
VADFDNALLRFGRGVYQPLTTTLLIVSEKQLFILFFRECNLYKGCEKPC